MEALVFEAIQAGGNVGLLLIGLGLLKIEGRVTVLEVKAGIKGGPSRGD